MPGAIACLFSSRAASGVAAWAALFLAARGAQAQVGTATQAVPSAPDTAGGLPAAPPDTAAGSEGFSPPPPVEGADAAADAGAAGWGDLASTSAEDAPVFRTKLYGFIDYHAGKVAKTPDSVDASGNTAFVENPWELDILNLNVMLQGSL